jgi:hypothetical protein
MYKVNDKAFNSFMEAVRYADSIKANVVEVATGLTRWEPAKPAKKRTIHVLVNKDGTTTEFGKVRN